MIIIPWEFTLPWQWEKAVLGSTVSPHQCFGRFHSWASFWFVIYSIPYKCNHCISVAFWISAGWDLQSRMKVITEIHWWFQKLKLIRLENNLFERWKKMWVQTQTYSFWQPSTRTVLNEIRIRFIILYLKTVGILIREFDQDFYTPITSPLNFHWIVITSAFCLQAWFLYWIILILILPWHGTVLITWWMLGEFHVSYSFFWTTETKVSSGQWPNGASWLLQIPPSLSKSFFLTF